jgi:carbamoylphosphate synthase small subunit
MTLPAAAHDTKFIIYHANNQHYPNPVSILGTVPAVPVVDTGVVEQHLAVVYHTDTIQEEAVEERLRQTLAEWEVAAAVGIDSRRIVPDLASVGVAAEDACMKECTSPAGAGEEAGAGARRHPNREKAWNMQ